MEGGRDMEGVKFLIQQNEFTKKGQNPRGRIKIHKMCVAADSILDNIFAASDKDKACEFFEEAKRVAKEVRELGNGSNVEVEVRFGKLEKNGRFIPGVSLSRFRFLCEWLDQSVATQCATKWCDSVVTQSETRRMETTHSSTKFYRKEQLRSVVFCSNQGVAFRFAISIETPVQEDEEDGPEKTTPSTTRLRQRKQFFVDAENGVYKRAFSVDFTLVWQAGSERGARELQRKGLDTRREIEVELHDAKYLSDKSSAYLAASFCGKLGSFFSLETDNFQMQLVR